MSSASWIEPDTPYFHLGKIFNLSMQLLYLGTVLIKLNISYPINFSLCGAADRHWPADERLHVW